MLPLVLRHLHQSAEARSYACHPILATHMSVQVAVRPLAHIAEYSVNAHKSGVIKHVDYLKVKVT